MSRHEWQFPLSAVKPMVDTSQADGGLGAVLTESRVARPLEEAITSVVGCSTLEEFLGCVTEKGWELQLQTVLMDKCTDTAVKTNPLQLAQLRQGIQDWYSRQTTQHSGSIRVGGRY